MGDTKRMPLFVFIAMLFLAAVFDLASLIPFIGNFLSALFIGFARLTFWLAGYQSRGTMAVTGIAAIVELIPGFSILPACMAFVVGFYVTNRKNTDKNNDTSWEEISVA